MTLRLFLQGMGIVSIILGLCALPVRGEVPSKPASQPSPECLKGITDPVVVKNRRLWLKETAGKNLALGKRVRFSPEPEYSLTAGDGDTTDLTDGKLSRSKDDRIWFDRDTVAWRCGSGGVNLMIDLGSVQPIEKVVARFLGGGEQGALLFPAEFQVLVSEDGKEFYCVASLTKLQLAERGQADWKTTYWLAEEGRAYMHPFVFSLKTKGRYVGLRVRGVTDMVCTDEIAVLQGDFPISDLQYPQESKTDICLDGVLLRPRKNYLAISTNIRTPNFFTITDCRRKDDRSKPVTLVLETPPQVAFLPTASTKGIRREELSGTDGHRVRWSIPAQGMGPYYLKIDGVLPRQAKARFYARVEGYAPHPVDVPIFPIEIPKVPPFKNLHVCLNWMAEPTPADWPGFFDAYAHLGFNAVPLFPRSWSGQPRYAPFISEARTRGFQLVCNESPFHVMLSRHKGDEEIYSQLDSGPSRNPCPAYFGRFYEEEIKRVGDVYALTGGTDYYIYDMELWYPGSQEAKAKKCRRCCQWQADHGGGRSMDECLYQMGVKRITDMYNEIQARSRKLNRPMPVVFMYDLHASAPDYDGSTNFLRVYPSVIKGSQPSLYMLSMPWRVHDEMQREYEAFRVKLKGSGPLIPFLTAGTYGEAAAENVEMIILETLLNGANGFDYYCFEDFDTPMDFYYHAKALAELAPYQTLLATGRPCPVKADNPALSTTGFGNGQDQMLVLVGNYQGLKPAKTTVTLPFQNVAEVRDLSRGQSLSARSKVDLVIPAHGFRLLHVRGQ